MTGLDTLPGGSFSIAQGINNRGQVVGYSDTTTGVQHAFLWQNGTMTDLGTLPSGSISVAYTINERGQIAGYGFDASGAAHALLWTK